MANIITVTDREHGLLRPYFDLTEAQLRNRLNPTDGLMIVESPKVIRTALQSGLMPVSLLCESRHISGDASDIVASLADDVPVITASRELLREVTGYTLTRGVLCAMHRPPMPMLAQIATGAKRVVVMHDITDTTNVGAIFRSAAALGVDAIVLNESACDPLNRRAIRVSMGSVFRVPWTVAASPVAELIELGFDVAALALRLDSIAIDDKRIVNADKLALVFGTEGDGLPQSVIDSCTHTVMIPMAHGVDSLNVAACAAVCCWATRV